MYQDAISFSLDALWCYNESLVSHHGPNGPDMIARSGTFLSFGSSFFSLRAKKRTAIGHMHMKNFMLRLSFFALRGEK